MNKKIWLVSGLVFILSCSFCCRVYMWHGPVLTAAGEQSTGRPVIVIDAGHGGMDGGAQTAGGVLEKDLNLAIAQALAEEAADYPVEVIMTRTGDEALYDDDDRPVRTKKREDLLRRKEIIETAGAAVAVSVHMNSFPQDASVYGAQVFYPETHKGRTDVRTEAPGSEQFAQSVQKSLEINVPDGRQREVKTKGDILLFKDIQAPVILVECGFLSNPEEAERLQTAEYQRLLAQSVWQGINEILCLEKRRGMAIIDSTNNEG